MMARAEYVYARVQDMDQNDEVILSFLAAIVAYKRLYEAMFRFTLAPDYLEALEQFKADFMSQWLKTNNIGSSELINPSSQVLRESLLSLRDCARPEVSRTSPSRNSSIGH